MEDGTWVSVLGVLVKVVAITAAGRTINQKLPRGETEALTWTLYSAGHTHTHAHTPADRLSHGFVTSFFVLLFFCHLISFSSTCFHCSSPFLHCSFSSFLFLMLSLLALIVLLFLLLSSPLLCSSPTCV